jgi:glycerophosphoryl diester phosphodiesterase
MSTDADAAARDERHDGGVPTDTRVVTWKWTRRRARPTSSRPRPRTGHAYLDARLEGGAGVLAFAHRGGAEHPDLAGLENTLHAFRHAHDLGFVYFETDVHVTRDGTLLAFHDRVLDRVTDRKGAISDLTHAEVQEALIGGRERVPTFAELVEAFPGAMFNIDLKAAGAARPLADLIEARGLHDRVLVGSFSRRRLGEFRRLTGGRVPTSATPMEVAAFRLLPSGRLADLVTGGRVAVLQVPFRRHGFTIVTRGLVRRAHAAGKHVHVWTVDDADEMRTLIARGVDGLMTDRTDILKSVLSESGHWRGRP